MTGSPRITPKQDDEPADYTIVPGLRLDVKAAADPSAVRAGPQLAHSLPVEYAISQAGGIV